MPFPDKGNPNHCTVPTAAHSIRPHGTRPHDRRAAAPVRLVTFRQDGKIRHGVLTEECSVVQPLGNGDLTVLVERMHERDELALGASGPALPLADVELLPPVPRPGKLLAAAPRGEGRPPLLFLKPPTAVAGPGAVVPLPSTGRELTVAAALTVVIGATAREVRAAEALDVVGGYVTSAELRAGGLALGFERDGDDRAGRFLDRLAGTWFDGFAPLGPWLVTPDEVPDPQDLDAVLLAGGERGHGSTREMPFPVAELVAFASTLMTLEPGDLIMTGALPGTGAPVAPGDEVSVTVGDLGTLVNRVA